MISLGVLTFSEASPYVTKIAESAAAQNIKVYLFSPSQLTDASSPVTGFCYLPEKKRWDPATFSIPPFIYDRSFYSSRQTRSHQYKIVELKQRGDIHFLGYGLPNKWKVYEALSSDQKLSPYLLQTRKLTSVAFFLVHFKTNHIWLLKPILGSQGRGLIKVEQLNGSFTAKEVIQPGEQFYTFASPSQLEKWLHVKMRRNEYMFQPYLPLHNQKGFPFDIRILLQKNEDGIWTERLRVIRKGIQHHITSNLAGGGEMLPYSKLLKGLTSAQRKNIEKDMQQIKDQLPKALENGIGSLFEIAIDIGMDQNQNLWILDINSKPGHKIVTMAPPSVQKEIYEAPGKYCRHLAAVKGYKLGVD
jgi:glutathione synthase/RimK-type ligase-like ATP-grasp enzyme